MTKENPKKLRGDGKPGLANLPVPVLLEVAKGMDEGEQKYGFYNWREVDIDVKTYYNSTMRHLMSWWNGEDIDPDSDIHHISKAISSLLVLRDSMLSGEVIDNRPHLAKEAKN